MKIHLTGRLFLAAAVPAAVAVCVVGFLVALAALAFVWAWPEATVATGSSSITAPGMGDDVRQHTSLSEYATMYWTDYGFNKIRRSNLYGSNPTDIVTGLNRPTGIALDVAAGKMYWTDSSAGAGAGKIRRANMDRSGVVEDLVTDLTWPYDMALDIAGGKMYWTDHGTFKIQRADLDGTNVGELLTTGSYPAGVALDVAGGKVYWTETGTGKIRRANLLDGSNPQNLLWRYIPSDIALDVAGGKMYWTDRGYHTVERANLDGTGDEELVDMGTTSHQEGIALDLGDGKMYWTNVGVPGHGEATMIKRANLDGTTPEVLVTTGLSEPWGIAMGPAPPPVGGIAVIPDIAFSGSSRLSHLALAGLGAVAFGSFVARAWYARRRKRA